MSILIDDSYDHEMRTLMVNGIEKYRLVINNESKPLYSKGWINFDVNLPKDGSNTIITYNYVFSNDRDGVYAFHDGFFRKDNERWYHLENDLCKINKLSSVAAVFEGWYTERERGQKIESIEHIFKYTNLFKYSPNTSIPQITLYARWKVRTYTVNVENITGKLIKGDSRGGTSRSTIEYNGMMRSGTIVIRDVLYNTDIIPYLRSHTGRKKIIPGITLDETEWQQSLREGKLQGFIGWHTLKDAGGATLSSYIVREDTTIYPQFHAMIVFPRVHMPSVWVGDTFYYESSSAAGCFVRNPGLTYNQAIDVWESALRERGWKDTPYPWNGRRTWKEEKGYFPLGSGDVVVINLEYFL